MSDGDIQPRTPGSIGGVGAHSRFGKTVVAHGDSGEVCKLGERTVEVVVEEGIGHRVVGNENVLPTIVVIVERDYAQAVGRLGREARLFADVGEGAVAVVAIQSRRLPMIDIGMAITSHSWAAIAAPEVPLRRPIHVVGDYQVKMPVIVGVKPCRA